MSYTNYNYSFRRNKISEPSQLTADVNIFTPTSDQKFMLGCIYETNDGRKFRYCKDSGTGIGQNLVVCGEPPDAQTVGNAQTAYGVSIGETKFDILLATGNGITDHELKDGYLWINASTPGSAAGTFYIIKDNYWVTSDTVMMVTIADEGGIRVAIAATDDISLQPNLCSNVKVNPTSLDACAVGVTQAVVTASYYFWAQYRGVTCCLVDASDTVVNGEPVGKAGTAGTAGSVGLVANDGTDAVYGTCVSFVAHTEYALVNLLIP